MCLILRASCLTLEINEFRCYEAKIEESENPSIHNLYRGLLGAGGCPAVVAQWQSTGGSSQRCRAVAIKFGGVRLVVCT